MNGLAAAGERKHQNVDRQGEKQHGERGEVAFALAVEDFDDHRAWSGEEVLDGEPNAAVVAEDGGEEVLGNELHREAARVGALSALGTEISFEFLAAVEAFRGVDGIAIGDLGLGFRSGLYFVFQAVRFLGAKVENTLMIRKKIVILWHNWIGL